MKLIVGLGNPGKDYEFTRHNIGRCIIEIYAKQHDLTLKKKLQAATFRQGDLMLAYFDEYMNLSGEPLSAIMRYFCIHVNDILVIHDELDLPFGQLRYRTKGSSAGHNGIKSIIHHLGTSEFKRLRIGISRPPIEIPVNKYVLGKFTAEERRQIPDIYQAVCQYFTKV